MDYEYGVDHYYNNRRGHVPAFGGWDWNDAVSFTECFDTATTQQHLNPQGFLNHHYASYPPQDHDLYIAGDLYDDHHLVAPAVILLPRRRPAKVGHELKAAKRVGVKEEKQNFKTEAREARESNTKTVRRRITAAKPVDEDLYKVSPNLLSIKSKRGRGGGFGCISRCFLPQA
ncbi:unnamed protein product [Cochlearia groenlandica]